MILVYFDPYQVFIPCHGVHGHQWNRLQIQVNHQSRHRAESILNLLPMLWIDQKYLFKHFEKIYPISFIELVFLIRFLIAWNPAWEHHLVSIVWKLDFSKAVIKFSRLKVRFSNLSLYFDRIFGTLVYENISNEISKCQTVSSISHLSLPLRCQIPSFNDFWILHLNLKILVFGGVQVRA